MVTNVPPVTLSRMRVFAAVAEAGSLTAAARRLTLSKSAVSRQISALEEQLGARLLVRNTRSLRLTEAGKVCLEAAQRIVGEARAAVDRIGEMAGRPVGALRLGAPVAFGRLHVAPLVAEFLVQHPAVQVELVLEDRKADLMREDLDLVVRIGALPDSELRGRRVGSVAGGLVAAPSYVERHGEPASVDDLSAHRLLDYTLSERPGRWLLEGPEGPAPLFFEPVARSNSGEVLRAMAEAGVGIASLPDFFVDRSIAEGCLMRLLPACRTRSAGVWVLSAPGRHQAVKVRSMTDWLAEQLPKRLGVPRDGNRPGG